MSCFEISISDDSVIQNIFDEIYRIKSFDRDKNRLEIILNEYLKLIYSNQILKIEFYDTRPPHSRPIFYNQIEEIFKILTVLKTIENSQINDTSWFSILWTPLKSNKSNFLNTSFLVYYSFINFDTQSENQEYIKMPIIGILPIKFHNKLFLTKIQKSEKSEIDDTLMKKYIVIITNSRIMFMI